MNIYSVNKSIRICRSGLTRDLVMDIDISWVICIKVIAMFYKLFGYWQC